MLSRLFIREIELQARVAEVRLVEISQVPIGY
jgi:hypothetical protein